MILAIIGLIAAVNPAAAGSALSRDRRTSRPAAVAIGAAVAALLLIAAAAAGDPFVDQLDVSLGTYRLGAGVVVVMAGLRWLIAGPAREADEPETDRGLSGFVVFPALVTPGALALAASIGADDEVAAVAAGAVVAAALGALALLNRRAISAAVLTAGVRFFGGVGVVIGVAVAVDGLKTL